MTSRHKRILCHLSVALTLLMFSAGSLWADSIIGSPIQPSTKGDPFILLFDENGNGSISINGGGFVPDPGLIGIDPLSGLTALYYPLPETVVAGDVGVSEPNMPSLLTDGLRFENGLFGFQAVMFYFSDNQDG